MAVAAADAVLDVMESEKLTEQADRVGGALRRAVDGMGDPGLGDGRGVGQFTGVDVIDSNAQPDPERAEAIVDRMRDHRVLIGRTGPLGAVLKIRPPLVFDEGHLEMLVEALRASLTETA